MRIFRVAVLFLLAMSIVSGVFGQRREIIEAVAEDVAGGSFAGDVYSNSRFGFSLTIPTGWNVMKQDDVTRTTAAGAELLKSKDEKTNKALEQGLNKEQVLFFVTKLPLGSVGNSIITASALKQADPRITSRIVMDATIKAVTANPNVKLTKPIEVRKIGGRSFMYAEVLMYLNSVIMRTKLYQSTVKGYSLSISHTYTRDEDEPVFDDVLKSVKFFK